MVTQWSVAGLVFLCVYIMSLNAQRTPTVIVQKGINDLIDHPMRCTIHSISIDANCSLFSIISNCGENSFTFIICKTIVLSLPLLALDRR